MDPVTGSMLVSAGSNLLGGLMSSSAQGAANAANAQEAQKNRDFQERMSNTAHQREAADLEAAGLNRILSVGSGASAPSGGAATAQAQTGLAESLGRAGSSAAAALQLNKDLEQKDAGIALTAAQTGTQLKQQEVLGASARKANAEAYDAEETMAANKNQLGSYYRYKSDAATASARTQAEKALKEQKLLDDRFSTERSSLAAKKSEAQLDKTNADFGQRAATYDNVMKRVDQAVGTASSAASIIKPGITIRNMQNENKQLRRDHHIIDKKTGEIK